MKPDKHFGGFNVQEIYIGDYVKVLRLDGKEGHPIKFVDLKIQGINIIPIPEISRITTGVLFEKELFTLRGRRYWVEAPLWNGGGFCQLRENKICK